ncbi:iron-sulfur assembly protein IscA-like 2, mitochondrial [Aricia agestis]|uniref:iron-sulfur assembly protein IscA-like 2, mitochondrial n=1 Tax=Aricia agestis TaxID=91739 RepID=UPI001C2083B0|nr:iron-sulfur assembly protein IscA-like 2, mitochondrial [Aricia agestis]
MILNSLSKLRALSSSYYLNRSVRFSSQKPQVASNDGLQLSDNCVQKLKQLCEENTFLRLCVESGGCSGFQYKFDIDSKIGDDDKVFERDGVKVVVDETSLEYIRGSTIDYHTELIRSAFRVEKNPNADIGCSCGASFSIKID